MTKVQIRKSIEQSGKQCSRAQFDRYLAMFKIKPIGIRQRPQQYPADSAERILKHLGISTFSAENGITAVREPIIAGRRTVKILTLKQIKSQTKKQK